MVFKIAIFPFQCGLLGEKSVPYSTELEHTSDLFVTFLRLRNLALVNTFMFAFSEMFLLYQLLDLLERLRKLEQKIKQM